MLLTILLFFFVGNLHHSMVEGMMNHHVIYPPHNDGNQHITLNLNDEDETIEFSPTEVSYMLIISADIRSKEMLGDKETQTYKKIQKILSEKQANFVEEEKQKKSDVISDQIIKCLEDKRIKLCNYYETIIKESLIEKNITQDVPSLNKRLQQIKSFDPKRAQQLSDDYNKVNDSRNQIINAAFELTQPEINYFVFYNLIAILQSIAEIYFNDNRITSKMINMTVARDNASKLFKYLSNTIFNKIKYKGMKVLKSPEEISAEVVKENSKTRSTFVMPPKNEKGVGSSLSGDGSAHTKQHDGQN